MHLASQSILPAIIVGLVRTVAWTWRLHLNDEAGLTRVGPTALAPLIWVFWHNRLLVIPPVYRRFFRHRKNAVLVSRSRDGGLLTECITRLGGEAVRGSSSRGGAPALRELQRKIAAGHDAYITPDGPRGPRYSMGAGAIWLAQQTGAAVMPVSIEVSGCWRLGRWDGFMIPKPFARVEVKLHELHMVRQTAENTTAESERERLRETMMSQTIRR